MKKTWFFLVIVACIVGCVAGLNFLIFQQDKILRKYFILNPQERMRKFESSLASSLSKNFARENGASKLEEALDYIKRYGRTSLFEMIFIFKDEDGNTKQLSKSGITDVTMKAISSEMVYPAAIDNGNVEGYLVIVIKEPIDSEFKEGLAKYTMITYSLRILYFSLVGALAIIALYHNYSAKIRLARDIAEVRASNDGMTGLHTNEYFKKVLEIEVEKFRIYNTPVALMMLDIDHFKLFNDRYGHPAGDKVLQEAARIIRSNTRATDILARYGGEEFSVIIPYVARFGEVQDHRKKLKGFVDEIRIVAERIRKNVEEFEIVYMDKPLRVTISIGVSFYYKRTEAISAARLLEKSDAALYKAKRLGRDRVCIDYEAAKTLA